MLLTEEIIQKVNDKGREDIGLEPGAELPDQYIFQYLDGALVEVDDGAETNLDQISNSEQELQTEHSESDGKELEDEG